MVDDRITFKAEIETVKIDLSEFERNEFQDIIFSKMAEKLAIYLDVSSKRLSEIIGRSAMKSQKSLSVPFISFQKALPQERYKIAEDMRNEIIRFLTDFLVNPENDGKLITVAEKMFVNYLKEFGSR